jgi:hypothetical protein
VLYIETFGHFIFQNPVQNVLMSTQNGPISLETLVISLLNNCLKICEVPVVENHKEVLCFATLKKIIMHNLLSSKVQLQQLKNNEKGLYPVLENHKDF